MSYKMESGGFNQTTTTILEQNISQPPDDLKLLKETWSYLTDRVNSGFDFDNSLLTNAWLMGATKLATDIVTMKDKLPNFSEAWVNGNKEKATKLHYYCLYPMLSWWFIKTKWKVKDDFRMNLIIQLQQLFEMDAISEVEHFFKFDNQINHDLKKHIRPPIYPKLFISKIYKAVGIHEVINWKQGEFPIKDNVKLITEGIMTTDGHKIDYWYEAALIMTIISAAEIMFNTYSELAKKYKK